MVMPAQQAIFETLNFIFNFHIVYAVDDSSIMFFITLFLHAHVFLVCQLVEVGLSGAWGTLKNIFIVFN